MLDRIMSQLPSGTVFFCTFLAFAAPYTIFRINQAFHQYGDPPWKQKQDETP